MVLIKLRAFYYALINGKLFTSCEDLPFYNFIKCLINNDYKYLRGDPKARKKAWECIFDEYIVIAADKSTSQYVSILKDINTISNKLLIVETLVNSLAIQYNPYHIKQLGGLGFRFIYANDETLKADLEGTISQCRMQLVTLQQRKQELASLERSKVKSKGATENDYWLQLSELSKFQAYHLNPKIITVSEYCAILCRFREANKP